MLTLPTPTDCTAMFLIGISLLGLLVGSFLNVVIARLPRMIENSPLGKVANQPFNLLVPRSHCNHCLHSIAWFDNIPLLSFIWLKARCRFCHKSISLQYPFVELLTSILSLLVAIRFGFTLTTFAGLILTWALIALAFIDFHHTILPDSITLPGLWVGLWLNAYKTFVTPESAILGAISGYLILWLVYWLFKWCTKKEGMGYGDFKLLAMLGAWLGWQSLPAIILLSSFLGSVLGISLIIIQSRDKNLPIPFGPFLAIGGFIALLWGSSLQTWYFKLIL